MAELPSGTLTFLFTDLEGSTRLWQDHPDAMRLGLARHDELLREAIESRGGYVVKTTGDGFHAAFSAAHDAIDAAVAGQFALAAEPWDSTGPLRVRMAIHSGPAELRDGDYYGTAVNRAARLMSVAHGGQVVVSSATEELSRDALAEGVVLDNCEHVLRAVAALLTAIEAACPNVRVLATSREGLGVRGEQNLTVPSLELPDDGTSPEAIGACDAVRLFVDRAQGAKAGFTVDATNADAVAQVCRRLDGVPLAIELAAARITSMNPAELARRLDRRFRLLTGGDRTAVERHQTLRATIDWSYDLLTEPEQRLLERLSVFAGGCALDAAETVCAGDPIDVDDVYELLANLVSRSLVVADDTGLDTRYRLLETIRQYGEERLAEHEETDRLRARHCDYYSDFAGVVRTQSYGAGQVEWGARLAREHDNLLAAMAFALATRDVERALRLLCQLPFPDLQVNDPVILDPDPILALPGASEHPGSAVALLLAGLRAHLRGDDPLALELCEQAFAAEARLGPVPDSHLAIFASDIRSRVASNAGALGESAELWLDASRHARADELPAVAAVYLGIAALTFAWFDPVVAHRCGTEGLELARETATPSAIATNLLALALTLAPDDPHRARALLNEALDSAATLGYENADELMFVVIAAARLDAWPTALRAVSRAFHHQLRSGGYSPLNVAGFLNLAARGLAEDQPEPAATLQGAAGAQVHRLVPTIAASTRNGVAAPPDLPGGAFVTGARRDATQMLAATLGEARLRELRTQGEVMHEDQAYTYARTHIDEYLATLEDVRDG